MKSDLSIQCNPHQNPNDILHRNIRNNPNPKNTQIAKAILNKNSKTGGVISNFMLQSHRNKNRRLDQWNRRSRNKRTQLQPRDS
jgi:protein involved in sex pheromone biosynthesis